MPIIQSDLIHNLLIALHNFFANNYDLLISESCPLSFRSFNVLSPGTLRVGFYPESSLVLISFSCIFCYVCEMLSFIHLLNHVRSGSWGTHFSFRTHVLSVIRVMDCIRKSTFLKISSSKLLLFNIYSFNECSSYVFLSLNFKIISRNYAIQDDFLIIVSVLAFATSTFNLKKELFLNFAIRGVQNQTIGALFVIICFQSSVHCGKREIWEQKIYNPRNYHFHFFLSHISWNQVIINRNSIVFNLHSINRYCFFIFLF